MKKCDMCRELKEDTEFAWRWKELGIRGDTCRECKKGYNKEYFEGPAKERHLQQVKERKKQAREFARKYLMNYLATHPCESCGESDVRVLEFHHIRGDKDQTVSRMVGDGFSVERIKQEVEKCQVLCSNCHRKLTMDERGWFRSKK